MELDEGVQSILAPVFQRSDFAGKGLNFHRSRSDFTDIITLQRDKYGTGKFCINLGSTPNFALSPKTSRAKLRAWDCWLGWRLTPQPRQTDYWWQSRSADPSLYVHIGDIFLQNGEPAFVKLDTIAHVFGGITPETLDANFGWWKEFGGLWKHDLAFRAAQAAKYLGDRPRAAALAHLSSELCGFPRANPHFADVAAFLDGLEKTDGSQSAT